MQTLSVQLFIWQSVLHVLCGKREKAHMKAMFLQCGSMVAHLHAFVRVKSHHLEALRVSNVFKCRKHVQNTYGRDPGRPLFMPAERFTRSLTCQKASQSVLPAFCEAWGPLVWKKCGFASTKRAFTCGSSPQGERVGGQARGCGILVFCMFYAENVRKHR